MLSRPMHPRQHENLPSVPIASIRVAAFDCFPNDWYSAILTSEERKTSLVGH